MTEQRAKGKGKAGRPSKPYDEKLVRVYVSMKPDERRRIEEHSKAVGKSINEYMKELALLDVDGSTVSMVIEETREIRREIFSIVNRFDDCKVTRGYILKLAEIDAKPIDKRLEAYNKLLEGIKAKMT